MGHMKKEGLENLSPIRCIVNKRETAHIVMDVRVWVG